VEADLDLQTDVDVLVTRLDVAYDEFGLDIYPDDTTFRTPSFVAGSQKIVATPWWRHDQQRALHGQPKPAITAMT
jgi:hypothetical protein